MDYLASAYTEGITRFDSNKNLLCFSDKAGKIQKMIFPRYVSLDGNTLTFIRQGDHLVWTDNRQYGIPKRMPKSYLGTIENYLYLEPINGKGPGQMLVPFQEIISESIPIASGSLAIGNQEPLILLNKDQEHTEQQGLFQYFVFQVDKGHIKPVSLEETLFSLYQ